MNHFILRFLFVALSTHTILSERIGIERVSDFSRNGESLETEVAANTTRLKCNSWCVKCKNSDKKFFVYRSQGYYAHAVGAAAFVFAPYAVSAPVLPLVSTINSMHNGCSHVEFRFGGELKETVNYPFMLTHSKEQKQQEYAEKCARISDPTYSGLKPKGTEETTTTKETEESALLSIDDDTTTTGIQRDTETETTTFAPGDKPAITDRMKKTLGQAGVAMKKKMIEKMTEHKENPDVYECFKHEWLCGEEGSEPIAVSRMNAESQCIGWTGWMGKVASKLKLSKKETNTEPETTG